LISGRVIVDQPLSALSNSSDEIPFAEFDTAVPQDVVRGRAVEIKVGQHEVHQVGLSFETHRVFTKGQGDVPILGAVNVTRSEGLHECTRFGDPRLEIRKALLRINMPRHFHTSEPRISPSGLNFYTGDAVPAWKGNLLIGGLSAEALVGLTLDGDKVKAEERIPMGARIRDVAQAPDGSVYVLTDQVNGRILRLNLADSAGK
jgi:hypothetical protein